jgi:hypothetical protein
VTHAKHTLASFTAHQQVFTASKTNKNQKANTNTQDKPINNKSINTEDRPERFKQQITRNNTNLKTNEATTTTLTSNNNA